MRLKLIKNGHIKENGASHSVNMYVRPGQGMTSPDSISEPNLTGRVYAKFWEYMSVQLIEAIRLIKLPSNEKFVFIMLAYHSKDDGNCWPSVRLLGQECCLSRREIQKCLSYLEKHSFIKKNFRPGHSTSYDLSVPASNGRDRVRPMDAQNLKLKAGQENQVCLIDGHTINCTHKKGVRFEGISKKRSSR